FFDINELAAIRVESEVVFRKTHGLILRLIREEKVTGLRVDHPDGLYNPSDYFRRLQRACFVQARLLFLEKQRGGVLTVEEEAGIETELALQYDEIYKTGEAGIKPFYIVGEKILLKGERMPDEWPIFSTTGYVYLNSLNGIFVDTANAGEFDSYPQFIRERPDLSDLIPEKKKLVMEVSMSSEINVLAHYLNRISEKDRHTRDFTLNSLRKAISEVIASFPVYRTYTNSYEVKDRDRNYIEQAVSKAKRNNPALSGSVFDFLRDVLLLRFPSDFPEDEKWEWLDFVMKFQQLTGPVMAKGVEDTAFYVYNRLVSLNEVGGMPERFGTTLDTFHGQNIERAKYWPHALIATSTHDTKRSEDVRARINVLSEIPEEWRRHLHVWSRVNRRKKAIVDGQRVPDRNEEYLLYQTLVGAWPVGKIGEEEQESFRKRMREYMVKAMREAKVNTSWIGPNAMHEEAVMFFIDSILDGSAGNQFLEDFVPFQERVSRCGMFNSLSQTILKITSPGVPDFYQGTEIWDFSLVDPDNRRPVDFDARMRMIEEIMRRERAIGPLRLMEELLTEMENGRVKLYLTHKALTFRRDNRELFERGEYMPLDVDGERHNNVCSFARRTGEKVSIVVAPRFFTRLIPQGGIPCGAGVWGEAVLMIPLEDGVAYRNILTGENIPIRGLNGARNLRLAEVFATSPVALLERIGTEE
ncbi:MAG: malto-oligosyltrehalose synthase, partial [Thermodesulfovibrionales bacterium]